MEFLDFYILFIKGRNVFKRIIINLCDLDIINFTSEILLVFIRLINEII